MKRGSRSVRCAAQESKSPEFHLWSGPVTLEVPAKRALPVALELLGEPGLEEKLPRPRSHQPSHDSPEPRRQGSRRAANKKDDIHRYRWFELSARWLKRGHHFDRW